MADAGMDQREISRLEQAWRSASDRVVAEAGRDIADYPAHLRDLINGELVRRDIRPAPPREFGIESDHWMVPALRGLHALVAYLLMAHRQRPYLTATVLMSMLALWSFAGGFPLSLLQGWAALLCYIGLEVLALAFACYPWRSYLIAVGVSLTGHAVQFFWSVVHKRFVLGLPPDEVRSLTWQSLKFGLIFPAVLSLLLCLLTYIRLRIRPIYPAGHCAKCGYCLFGLTESRCPECGTPFALESAAKGSPSGRAASVTGTTQGH